MLRYRRAIPAIGILLLIAVSLTSYAKETKQTAINDIVLDVTVVDKQILGNGKLSFRLAARHEYV